MCWLFSLYILIPNYLLLLENLYNLIHYCWFQSQIERMNQLWNIPIYAQLPARNHLGIRNFLGLFLEMTSQYLASPDGRIWHVRLLWNFCNFFLRVLTSSNYNKIIEMICPLIIIFGIININFFILFFSLKCRQYKEIHIVSLVTWIYTLQYK